MAALLVVLTGCSKVPQGKQAVSAVDIRGAKAVDEDDLEDEIVTTRTSKFLGLFPGVLYDYSVFDRYALQRDLARVEASYRARGYYQASARAGRVHEIDGKHVRVEIVVDEGKPVHVRQLVVGGLEKLPRPLAIEVERAIVAALPKGAIFAEEAFDKASAGARHALMDRGHAWAKVEKHANVDLVGHAADVTFTVEPGPRAILGEISITGLGKLPEKQVRRTLDLDTGAPFSESEIEAAEQALLDLGVFSSVDVVPAYDVPPPGPEPIVLPLTVRVEPSRLRTVRLGGGVEFDALKTDVHGIIGWEHRNFFGGLRSFSVNFRPGVVLYPLRATNLTAPDHFFPEERLRVELRQPTFIEARTTGFIRPELNVYPVLLNPDPPPNQPVLGYLEGRLGIGVDRTFKRLFVALSHNTQHAFPFSYLGPKDPTLGPINIFYPELLAQLDFRDDRVRPRRGVWFGNTFQVAGGPFRGDADDVKIQPDLRGYVPITRRLVIAGRTSVGFLWPRNYGDAVQTRRSRFDDERARTRDYQLTFFRGFFSGGPSSNRGYPIRGVGPYDFVPFLTPDVAAAQTEAGCLENSCRVPTGGFTLWEASVEGRYDLSGPLSAALFCDASDVSPQTNDIRLDHLHLSCGAGARYDTPVGPIRVDLGYRIPGLQVLGGVPRTERVPPDLAFGIPIALSVGIGEAY